jgi:hypothetical protein
VARMAGQWVARAAIRKTAKAANGMLPPSDFLNTAFVCAPIGMSAPETRVRTQSARVDFIVCGGGSI